MAAENLDIKLGRCFISYYSYAPCIDIHNVIEIKNCMYLCVYLSLEETCFKKLVYIRESKQITKKEL